MPSATFLRVRSISACSFRLAPIALSTSRPHPRRSRRQLGAPGASGGAGVPLSGAPARGVPGGPQRGRPAPPRLREVVGHGDPRGTRGCGGGAGGAGPATGRTGQAGKRPGPAQCFPGGPLYCYLFFSIIIYNLQAILYSL